MPQMTYSFCHESSVVSNNRNEQSQIYSVWTIVSHQELLHMLWSRFVSSLFLWEYTLTNSNQLIFALSDVPNWVEEHEGYSFSALYDFIINFFEAPDLGPKATERTKALLTWWDRCVIQPVICAAMHNATIQEGFPGLPTSQHSIDTRRSGLMRSTHRTTGTSRGRHVATRIL